MAHGQLRPHGGYFYLEWINNELIMRARIKAWRQPNEDGIVRAPIIIGEGINDPSDISLVIRDPVIGVTWTCKF